jgi:thioredoxin-dependent peroxiredoxin
MLKPGQPAPDFELRDGQGQTHSLRALRERGPVVVFFYPRDESPICTREVCAFRDAYQDFLDAGASVVGISSDGEKSHAAFSAHHALPYPLLADPGGTVRRAFGIPKMLGVTDGRATFIVDRQGVIRESFLSQIQAGAHVQRALERLHDLAAPVKKG